MEPIEQPQANCTYCPFSATQIPTTFHIQWPSPEGCPQEVQRDIGKIVLDRVMQFLKVGDINSGPLWPCSNTRMRHYWPFLASWLADHHVHGNLIHVKCNACPNRQTPKDKLGLLILLLDMEFHWRKSAVFQQKYWYYMNAKTARDHQAIQITQDWFESVRMRLVACMFRDLPHVEAHDLHPPDIIHIISVRMFDHLMTWMYGFLQCHCRAPGFDEIWDGIPPYPNLYHIGETYWRILQWSSKQIITFGRII